MRIVANPEFLTLPNGTLFCRYMPVNLGPLEIKGETSNTMNDFLFQGLIETALVGDAFMDYMLKGLPVGKKFDLYEGDCWGRDGEYDEDALYAVFEKADVENVMNKLMKSFSTAYSKN